MIHSFSLLCTLLYTKLNYALYFTTNVCDKYRAVTERLNDIKQK